MSNKSDRELSDRIVKLLGSGPNKISGIRKLVSSLGLPSHAQRTVRRLLRRLVSEGLVVSEGRGRYSLAAAEQELEGILAAGHRGWLTLRSEQDGRALMRIGPESNGGALAGDSVRARATRQRRDRAPEGRVLEITARGGRPIVGVLRKQAKACFVIPDEAAVGEPVMIQGRDLMGARDGQVVAVVVSDLQPHAQLRGRLVRVLGEAGDFATEVERLLLEHGLRRGFPATVQSAADGLGHKPRGKNRVDLRSLPFVTIDPPQAKDFDDAVYVQPRGRGFKLWVGIADVSSFVQVNSVIDREAVDRGCSTYLPGAVFPMLPEKISEDLCSLAPGVDRPALVVELDVEPSGKVKGGRAHRATIRSTCRLTYQEVQAALDGGAGQGQAAPLIDDLKLMADCASRLLSRMRDRGQLAFDLPEADIQLDSDGWPIEVRPSKQLFSQKLIESFMVAANEAIARYLTKCEAPVLYRSHPPPDSEKIEEFMNLASALGAPAPFSAQPSPRQIGDYLASLKGKAVAQLLEQTLLRSLKQAAYTVDGPSHFGLASECYLHFTSPIRRYPDLLVHRQLGRCLDLAGPEGADLNRPLIQEQGWPVDPERCAALADLNSRSERKAMVADREALALYSAAYLSDRIGQRFPAHVSHVAEFGLFLRLKPSGVEGLVHMSRMGDDYYRYDGERMKLTGRRNGKTFQVGQLVRAEVESVNLSERQVDFLLVDGQED